jgi:hypothetical protein
MCLCLTFVAFKVYHFCDIVVLLGYHGKGNEMITPKTLQSLMFFHKNIHSLYIIGIKEEAKTFQKQFQTFIQVFSYCN